MSSFDPPHLPHRRATAMNASAHRPSPEALAARPEPIDICDLLVHRHRRIEALLGEVMAGRTPWEQRRAVSTVGDELLRHLDAEARVVYPAVHAACGAGVFAGAASAHGAIERALAALHAHSPADPGLDAACRRLGEEIARHHAGQEQVLFPALHLLFDAAQREALGREAQRDVDAGRVGSVPPLR